MIQNITPVVQLLLQALTFLGILFAVYKYFRDPDVKVANELDVLKASCKLRHESIDSNILVIKENHLRHIEAAVAQMQIDLATLRTLVEERLQSR